MYKAGKARRAFFAVAVGCCALTFTVLGQTAGCIAGQHEDAEGVCVVCEPDTYSTTIGATECTACPVGLFAGGATPQSHDSCVIVDAPVVPISFWHAQMLVCPTPRRIPRISRAPMNRPSCR